MGLKISLIITTYNREDALQVTVRNALAQTRPPDEILIADDGSGPATKALVEQLSASSHVPIIHAWQEDDGFRPGRARNLAIAASSGKYVILVDGDIVMDPDFVLDHEQCA